MWNLEVMYTSYLYNVKCIKTNQEIFLHEMVFDKKIIMI